MSEARPTATNARSILSACAWLLLGLGLGALSTRPLSTASHFPWSVTPFVFVFLWAICSTIGAGVAIFIVGRVRSAAIGAVTMAGAVVSVVAAQWLSSGLTSPELMVGGYGAFALGTSFTLVFAAGTASRWAGRAALFGGFAAAAVAAPALAISGTVDGTWRRELLEFAGPSASTGGPLSWALSIRIGVFGDDGSLGTMIGLAALILGAIVLIAMYRWTFAPTAILDGTPQAGGINSRADDTVDDLASIPFMVPALTFAGISVAGVLVLSLVPDLIWAAFAAIACAGFVTMAAVAWIWARAKAAPWMVWFAISLGLCLPLVVAVGPARGLTLIALVAAPAVVAICRAAADRGSAVRAAFLLAGAGLWSYAPTAATLGLMYPDWTTPLAHRGSVQYLEAPISGDLSTVYAQLGLAAACLVIGAVSLWRHRARSGAAGQP